MDDLATAAEVKPTTVRTVLRRNASLFERLGQAEGDGRGGRWIRYRMRPEMAAVSANLMPDAASPGDVDSRAALGLLLDVLPHAQNEHERESILRRARRLIERSVKTPDAPPLIGEVAAALLLRETGEESKANERWRSLRDEVWLEESAELRSLLDERFLPVGSRLRIRVQSAEKPFKVFGATGYSGPGRITETTQIASWAQLKLLLARRKELENFFASGGTLRFEHPSDPVMIQKWSGDLGTTAPGAPVPPRPSTDRRRGT